MPSFVRVAMFLLAAAVVAGCSNGSDTSANYVGLDPVEPVDGVNITTTSASEAREPVEPTVDFLAIEELLEGFLEAQSQVIVGSTDISALDEFALGGALDATVAERDANSEKAAAGQLSAIDLLAAWPNVTSIETDGATLVVRDCTERQEVNSAGQFNLWFVDHRFLLQPDGDDGAFKVADVEVIHNGFLDSARFGCVPQSFAERAEATAERGWQEMVAAASDPSARPVLSDVFDDELQSHIESTITDQSSQNLMLATNETTTLTSIGVDTQTDLLVLDASEKGTTVVVEACRSFPDGVVVTDAATEVEMTVVEPGAEFVQWIYVRIPTQPAYVDGPEQVIAIEDQPDLSCGDRP